MLHDCEGIALCAQRESGLDDRPHADPAILAVAWGRLRLVPIPGAKPHLDGDAIIYSPHAPPQARAYLIGHELGHKMIQWAGLRLDREDEERAASIIGCAVMLPRRALMRDAKAGRDLLTLWPLATATILRRRLADVRTLTGWPGP